MSTADPAKLIAEAVERIVADWHKSQFHMRASAERELLAVYERGKAEAGEDGEPTDTQRLDWLLRKYGVSAQARKY
jgi:hypothetical protein